MKHLLTLFWIAFIGTLVYIYFYHPATFEKMFTWDGPGSPFVNTPRQD